MTKSGLGSQRELRDFTDFAAFVAVKAEAEAVAQLEVPTAPLRRSAPLTVAGRLGSVLGCASMAL